MSDDEFGSKKQKNYLGANPGGRDAPTALLFVEPCLPSGPKADLRIATPKLGSIDPILPLQFIELDQHIFMRASCGDRFNLLVHKVG